MWLFIFYLYRFIRFTYRYTHVRNYIYWRRNWCCHSLATPYYYALSEVWCIFRADQVPDSRKISSLFAHLSWSRLHVLSSRDSVPRTLSNILVISIGSFWIGFVAGSMLVSASAFVITHVHRLTETLYSLSPVWKLIWKLWMIYPRKCLNTLERAALSQSSVDVRWFLAWGLSFQ